MINYVITNDVFNSGSVKSATKAFPIGGAMNKLIAGVTMLLAILFVSFARITPVFASSVQIQNVSFHYDSYAGDYGVYIQGGTVVTIVVSLYGSGTFWVCGSQMVQYQGGGSGDGYGFACDTVKLGNWFGPTQSTDSMRRMVRTSAPGWLYIQVVVYDANGSHSVPAATSQWYQVVIII
jgi:hypothetical protein